MIKEDVRFEDLPQDGILIVNNKKVKWYDCYKWDNWEQYDEWRKWARSEMEKMGVPKVEYTMRYIDLRYGLTIRYKKEGEMF